MFLSLSLLYRVGDDFTFPDGTRPLCQQSSHMSAACPDGAHVVVVVVVVHSTWAGTHWECQHERVNHSEVEMAMKRGILNISTSEPTALVVALVITWR